MTLAATTVLALGLMAAGGTASHAQNMSPQNIADRVEDELTFDQAVSGQNIDVKVVDGIAMLTGTADNLLAKRRATELASTVKGVRSVTNRVQIEAGDRTDAAIKADINDALLLDPATETFDVALAVNDGEVTLTGTVESWQEKQLTEKVAAGVRGVTAIDNQLSINYVEERPDSELQTEIEHALRWNARVDHALIDVSVDDSEATLEGVVGSAAEKTEAPLTACVHGIHGGHNDDLEVQRWARDEDLREDKYVDVNDAEIRDAINDAMLYDPRVNSFNIAADVDDGKVTLRGTVDNLKAKRTAEHIARNTVGVIRPIANRIDVIADETLSDTAIRQDLREAIRRDPYLETYEVTTFVEDGVATLTGTVDTFFERSQAEDVAARTPGVIAVDNELTVDRTFDLLTYDPYIDPELYAVDAWYDYEPGITTLTDSQLKEEINDELWWSPFVNSDDVNVSVDDGTATLTGEVGSWSELQAATENAYDGGALFVRNNLEIESDS